MPHPSLDSFFFWNSGSEAVDGAIKMARILTGRQNIISMQGAYHGRTFGAMAVTKSKTVYSEGVHPLMVRTSFIVGYIFGSQRNEHSAGCVRAAVPVLAPTWGTDRHTCLKGLRDVSEPTQSLVLSSD